MGKVNNIDLKKVAGAALDAMSLWEHDMHYHDGNYRGGKCLYRERLAAGDRSDAALAEANERETAIHNGRRYEGRQIETGIAEEFGLGQKKGTRIEFMEPDANGLNRLEVIGRAEMPDDFFDEGRLRAFFKKRGYEFRGMKVTGGEKSTENGKERTKAKKVFEIDAFRPENIRFADEGPQTREVGEVTEVEGSGEELGDDAKSRLLRMYGLKSEGGKIQRRTGADSARDRARKYMGLVGDWEGQSNREDAESGKWEKERLASLKRAAEARKAEMEAR